MCYGDIIRNTPGLILLQHSPRFPDDNFSIVESKQTIGTAGLPVIKR